MLIVRTCSRELSSRSTSVAGLLGNAVYPVLVATTAPPIIITVTIAVPPPVNFAAACPQWSLA